MAVERLVDALKLSHASGILSKNSPVKHTGRKKISDELVARPRRNLMKHPDRGRSSPSAVVADNNCRASQISGNRFMARDGRGELQSADGAPVKCEVFHALMVRLRPTIRFEDLGKYAISCALSLISQAH